MTVFLELIFEHVWKKGQFHLFIFYMWIYNWPLTIDTIDKLKGHFFAIAFSIKYCLCHQEAIHVWVYFWTLFFVLLVYLSLQQYHTYYSSFITSLYLVE